MWFKRKKPADLPNLPFKSGEGFFQYWCKYGDNRLEIDTPILGIVLDARDVAGTAEAVKVSAEGNQTAMVRVTSDDGGFEVLAETSGQGDLLVPGDLVMWLPGVYLEKLAAISPDPRTGWMGLIIAKVAAELNPNTNQFRVLSRYSTK